MVVLKSLFGEVGRLMMIVELSGNLAMAAGISGRLKRFLLADNGNGGHGLANLAFCDTLRSHSE